MKRAVALAVVSTIAACGPEPAPLAPKRLPPAPTSSASAAPATTAAPTTTAAASATPPPPRPAGPAFAKIADLGGDAFDTLRLRELEDHAMVVLSDRILELAKGKVSRAKALEDAAFDDKKREEHKVNMEMAGYVDAFGREHFYRTFRVASSNPWFDETLSKASGKGTSKVMETRRKEEFVFIGFGKGDRPVGYWQPHRMGPSGHVVVLGKKGKSSIELGRFNGFCSGKGYVGTTFQMMIGRKRLLASGHDCSAPNPNDNESLFVWTLEDGKRKRTALPAGAVIESGVQQAKDVVFLGGNLGGAGLFGRFEGGRFTRLDAPAGSRNVKALAAQPNGDVWLVTDHGRKVANRVWRLSKGKFAEVALPKDAKMVSDVHVARDGWVWAVGSAIYGYEP